MLKRGQATLFIVLAIIIAVSIIFIFALKPKSLILDSKTDFKEFKQNFEECLKTKLSYAIVSNNFISQPNLVLAKSYLEDYMNREAIKCSDVFSDFPNLKITDNPASIKSTIKFDGMEFNDITKIDIELYYPMTISHGNKEDQISRFETGVVL